MSHYDEHAPLLLAEEDEPSFDERAHRVAAFAKAGGHSSLRQAMLVLTSAAICAGALVGMASGAHQYATLPPASGAGVGAATPAAAAASAAARHASGGATLMSSSAGEQPLEAGRPLDASLAPADFVRRSSHAAARNNRAFFEQFDENATLLAAPTGDDTSAAALESADLSALFRADHELINTDGTLACARPDHVSTAAPYGLRLRLDNISADCKDTAEIATGHVSSIASGYKFGDFEVRTRRACAPVCSGSDRPDGSCSRDWGLGAGAERRIRDASSLGSPC